MIKTVGDLRKELENVPDDQTIAVSAEGEPFLICYCDHLQGEDAAESEYNVLIRLVM